MLIVLPDTPEPIEIVLMVAVLEPQVLLAKTEILDAETPAVSMIELLVLEPVQLVNDHV